MPDAVPSARRARRLPDDARIGRRMAATGLSQPTGAAGAAAGAAP